MWSRSLPAIAVLCGWSAAHCVPACAAEVFAQLFPLTGEVRLLNKGTEPIPFAYYSITSPGQALDGSGEVWKSISDYYDVSGNGLIDPSHEWFTLSDDADELTEAVFAGPGGNLPPTRAISLGNIWNPYAVSVPDLVFDVWNDEEPIPVTIELALDGDYSSNQVVDLADYIVWRRYVDSITMLLADGDLNGVVDDGDYQVWRQNFGLTLPLPPYETGNGSQSGRTAARSGVVPEPMAGALFLIAASSLLSVMNRRRRTSSSGRATIERAPAPHSALGATYGCALRR